MFQAGHTAWKPGARAFRDKSLRMQLAEAKGVIEERWSEEALLWVDSGRLPRREGRQGGRAETIPEKIERLEEERNEAYDEGIKRGLDEGRKEMQKEWEQGEGLLQARQRKKMESLLWNEDWIQGQREAFEQAGWVENASGVWINEKKEKLEEEEEKEKTPMRRLRKKASLN